MAVLKLWYNNPYVTGYSVELPVDQVTVLKRKRLLYNTSSIKDRSHRIVYGDKLWMLAYKYYGDSKFWWVIADVNNIINPFELTVGLDLLIPDIEVIKTAL